MDVKKCCESDVFFWFVHSVKSVFARRGKYRYSLKWAYSIYAHFFNLDSFQIGLVGSLNILEYSELYRIICLVVRVALF